jgi:hypothetical protein
MWLCGLDHKHYVKHPEVKRLKNKLTFLFHTVPQLNMYDILYLHTPHMFMAYLFDLTFNG